jgi:hypothetical protein
MYANNTAERGNAWTAHASAKWLFQVDFPTAPHI